MKKLLLGSISTPTLIFAFLVSLGIRASAQPLTGDGPLFRQTFENGDTGGWMVFGGDKGKLSFATEPADVKEGKSALRFEYNIAKGAMTALLLAPPTAPNAETLNIKSVSCWVKADYNAPLAFILQEMDGGRYIYLCTAPKDKWQHIEVAPSEFVLSEDKDSPDDPNKKLDLDKVMALAIGDMGQFFAQDEKMAAMLNIRMGAHTLLLDDMVAGREEPPRTKREPLPRGVTEIDGFLHPQVGWIGLGDMGLSIARDEAGEPTLQATYRQEINKVAGLARRVPRGTLKGMERITFRVASNNPAALFVQLEEPGGGKYQAPLLLHGDEKVVDASLPLAGFKAAQDSKDENNKLDLEQVNQLMIMDITGMINFGEGENSLWLRELRLVESKE